jgi:Flp pilus assembly protein TadD
MNDVASADQLYSKTLNANGNAPLIMAGQGQVELIKGNKDKARQLFEQRST